MTGRACGDCTLCCKVMAIEQLAKPAAQWCRHCKPGHGCQIYHDRPVECRQFNCLWLIDERFGPHWKPNKSKLVLTTSADGIEVRCDSTAPDAWRKEPFQREIRALAAAGEAHDVTMLVIIGSRMILVATDREFDLGLVGADERIVREFDGGQLVGAAVIKASDLERD
ncbi:MAG: hypothetical protein JOZ74_00285 [Bradyrhizobium sp.]|nr:hypothetical protein [Bradyrhizobium sp.]